MNQKCWVAKLRPIFAMVALLAGCGTASLGGTLDVPPLAKLKAAAEAGDARAQYRYGQTFSALSHDWTRWLVAAATQGYGPAEDELAWVPNWSRFIGDYKDPKIREAHLKANGAKMRQALIWAASAADKGFPRSRLLLAHAYAHGLLLPHDRVEAYKWVSMYAPVSDILADSRCEILRKELIRTMSIAQIEEAQARAQRYGGTGTGARIRRHLVASQLRLSAIASAKDVQLAYVNDVAFKAGETQSVQIDGASVAIRCVRISRGLAVITLPPDETEITLRMN